MKNRLLPFLAVLALPAPAHALGTAAHAYLADQLGNPCGDLNTQEIYGGILPDIFNLASGSYADFMYTETHDDFDAVIDAAVGPRLRAVAYGFASHNVLWGADSEEQRYVEPRAAQLVPVVQEQFTELFEQAGVPDAASLAVVVAVRLSHTLIETAADLRIVSSGLDPQIGRKIHRAAADRAPGVPLMLDRAYARDLGGFLAVPSWIAAIVIHVAEAQFREAITHYGDALQQPEEQAIALLAEQGVQLLEQFLEEGAGVSVTIDPELLAGLLRDGAMPLVNDFDTQLPLMLQRLQDEMRQQGPRTPQALCTLWNH